MQPRQHFRSLMTLILILIYNNQNSFFAQCAIAYASTPPNVINLALSDNCTATFDASARISNPNQCQLLYFKDAALTQPFSPNFDKNQLGQTIDVYVAAEDGNPTTPLANPLKFSVRPTDITPPTVTCPANLTFNTTICNYLINNDIIATYSDNCSQNLNLTWQATGSTSASGNNSLLGASFIVGKSTVTYKVTDLSSNSATCSFTVNILETTPPTLVKCPNDISIDAPANACGIALASGLIPEYMDNCTPTAAITLSYELSGATTKTGVGAATAINYNVGTTRVQYTAKDELGNSNTACAFNVTVKDVTKPQLICPADIVANSFLDSCHTRVPVPQLTPFATDNCGLSNLSFQYAVSGATTAANQTITNIVNQRFPKGISIITYTASDAFQNTATCTQKITVTDQNKPKINCNTTNMVLQTVANECSMAITLPTPTATDNCSNNIGISYSLGGATIASGNGYVPQTQFFQPGITTVTYKATDEDGNSAECSYQVRLTEFPAIKPTLKCPQDMTLSTGTNDCQTTLTANTKPISASDNCTSVANLKLWASFSGATQQADSLININKGLEGFKLNVGITKVRYILEDASFNRDTCFFNITIKDTQKPIIQCIANIRQEAYFDCYTLVPQAKVTATDNCNANALKISYLLTGATDSENSSVATLDNVFFNVGTTNVFCRAEDAAGNFDTCSFKVVIFESYLPLAKCRTNVDIALDPTGNYTMPAVMFDNGSSDDCTPNNELQFSASKTQFNCSNLGKNEVLLTVKDGSGNSATCTASVNVKSSFANLNLDANITTQTESYWGAADGKATVTVTGGTGTYTYLWSNGKTTTTIDQLGAGRYTITVTDNTSKCATQVSASMSDGPLMSFGVGNIIDVTNSTVLVPVRVRNFNKVKKFNLNLQLVNPTIATIEGIQDIGVDTNDTISHQYTNSSVTFAYATKNQNGLTLANGTALFNIKVKLIGKVGDYSAINFTRSPEVQQYLPAGLISIPTNPMAGAVGISDNSNGLATISGAFIREDGAPINDVNITMSGTYPNIDSTKTDGKYSFTMPYGARAVIRGSKEDLPRRGLTATDALMVQRHILGYDSLRSEYTKIAADVNRTGSLTAADVLEIKRVILGYQTAFSKAKTWEFVPADFVFTKLSNPNRVPAFSDSLVLSYLLQNQQNKNIIAIKAGDVNLSANTGFSLPHSIDISTLWIEDKKIAQGDIFTVNVYNEDDLTLGALQTSIHFDNKNMSLQKIQSDVLQDFDAKQDCNIVDNEINLMWLNAKNQNITKAQPVLSLQFKALNDINRLHNQIVLGENTPSLLVDNTAEKTIQLRYKKVKQSTTTEDNISLYPNPATTVINLRSDNAIHTISITDMQGRLVYTQQYAPSDNILSKSIPVDALPKGIYNVAIQTAQNISYKNIMIQ